MLRGDREERKEDHREDKSSGADAVLGAAAGAGVPVAANYKRHGDSSPSDDKGSSDGNDGLQTFAMREKLLTFGNDFTINKLNGKRTPAFYTSNKFLRMRGTFTLQDRRGGKILYQIQERKLRVRDSMAIEDAQGDKIAEIKKIVVGVVRDNYVVKVRGDENWQVHGSILEHDFTIKEDGREIVKVHKKWVAPIKDCYFIDIHGTDNVALALMVVIGLESMSNED